MAGCVLRGFGVAQVTFHGGELEDGLTWLRLIGMANSIRERIKSCGSSADNGCLRGLLFRNASSNP